MNYLKVFFLSMFTGSLHLGDVPYQMEEYISIQRVQQPRKQTS